MADQQQTTNRGRAPSRIPRSKKSRDEDPKIIGQWKVGRTIGKGSSGRVKIARHVKTHQYAAIKIVSKSALLHSRMSMSDAPAQAQKVILGIEREIVIMKLIDHPNVLSLYDVWETGNELYLIMEYVEGGELFDYLVSKGRLPANEALHYFQQIISAISYCHGFNIAHRDLKPENLLLSKSSSGRNIKVADFGMAAYTDPKVMLSTSCGSPHYASPEVIEGRLYKGNISDIWSCGVILYALLAGRLPFDHENLRILLEKVKMATYTMPADIPSAAQNLISRMLEKDVTRRITMAEIQKHPFFLASPPSPSHLFEAKNPTLDHISCSIEKPVQSEEDIDADIFDNLRTLWHGAPAREIIDNLVNEKKTWEKAVYHLLLRYRSRHLENYNMEDENEEREGSRPGELIQATPLFPVEGSEHAEKASENITEQTTQGVTQDEADDMEKAAAYTARPSAPTPQRAVWYKDGRTSEDSDVFTSIPHHAHTVTSPMAPLPSPLCALDTSVNASTSTLQRALSVNAAGPTPPPLPTDLMHSTAEGQTPPIITLQEASPMRPEEAPAHGKDNQILSPGPSPSPLTSPFLDLPFLDVPNLQDVDETVQRFFHQIVEHLNIMQMRQAHSSTASSHSATPDPGYSGLLTTSPDSRWSPGDATRVNRGLVQNHSSLAPSTMLALSGTELDPDRSRFEDAEEDLGVWPTPTADPQALSLGLGISDYHTEFHGNRPAPRPPSRQQQQRAQPSLLGRASLKATSRGKTLANSTKRARASENKENASLQQDSAEAERGQVRKKSSLRSSDGERKPLGKKHVQIILPREKAEDRMLKQRQSILPTRSTETSPTLSDGSSFLPADSISKRSWFGNLFTFKPASYNLLSVHGAYTTREECARLLRAFGVAVLLTNTEGNGLLKCRLDEVRDPAGVMAVAKAVRFRVELHAVTYAHSISGYVTSLTLVQEKGALSSFKLVYNRLRREWELDVPPSSRTPSSVYGPLSISPRLAPGRFSGAAHAM